MLKHCRLPIGQGCHYVCRKHPCRTVSAFAQVHAPTYNNARQIAVPTKGKIVETLLLDIGGMSCGGCVKSVTRILESVKGVASVEVSLENKSATVGYDPAQTAAEALIEAVEDGGYDAALK